MSNQTPRVTESQCYSGNNVNMYRQMCQLKGHKGAKLDQCAAQLGQHCSKNMHIGQDVDIMNKLFQCYQDASKAPSGEQSAHVKKCEIKYTSG